MSNFWLFIISINIGILNAQVVYWLKKIHEELKKEKQ